MFCTWKVPNLYYIHFFFFSKYERKITVILYHSLQKVNLHIHKIIKSGICTSHVACSDAIDNTKNMMSLNDTVCQNLTSIHSGSYRIVSHFRPLGYGRKHRYRRNFLTSIKGF